MTDRIRPFLAGLFGNRYSPGVGIDWNRSGDISLQERFIDLDHNGSIDHREECFGIGLRQKEFTFEAGAKNYARFERIWNATAIEVREEKIKAQLAPTISDDQDQFSERVQQRLFAELGVSGSSELTTKIADRVLPAIKMLTEFPNIESSTLSIENASKIYGVLKDLAHFSPRLAGALRAIEYYDCFNYSHVYGADVLGFGLCISMGGLAHPEYPVIFINDSLFAKLDLDGLSHSVVAAHEATHVYHLGLMSTGFKVLKNKLATINDEMVLSFDDVDLKERLFRVISEPFFISKEERDTHPFLAELVDAGNVIIRDSFNYKWLSIDREALERYGKLGKCLDKIYDAKSEFERLVRNSPDIAATGPLFNVEVIWVEFLGETIPFPGRFVGLEIEATNDGETKDLLKEAYSKWYSATRDFDLCVVESFRGFAKCVSNPNGAGICKNWRLSLSNPRFGMSGPYGASSIAEDVATLVQYIFENGEPPFTGDPIHNDIIRKKVALLVEAGFLPEKYKDM